MIECNHLWSANAGTQECPSCGNNRQVWRNQITGKLTCHRAGCHMEVEGQSPAPEGLEVLPEPPWTDAAPLIPSVPEGYRTTWEWAREWGISRRTALEKLQHLLARGQATCAVFLAPNCGFYSVVRPTAHYRLCQHNAKGAATSSAAHTRRNATTPGSASPAMSTAATAGSPRGTAGTTRARTRGSHGSGPKSRSAAPTTKRRR